MSEHKVAPQVGAHPKDNYTVLMQVRPMISKSKGMCVFNGCGGGQVSVSWLARTAEEEADSGQLVPSVKPPNFVPHRIPA